jgi:Alpha-glutamyl/putrescinyl thymine pyrophosphorylase clade 3
MSRFCRHNRFIERCPICRETLPDYASSGDSTRRTRSASSRGSASGSTAKRAPTGRGTPGGPRSRTLHVRHELRAVDDGYRSELVPGLRASHDAARLADELAFAAGRLSALTTAPPDLYGEVREQAARGALEQATWTCFLTVYLCPLEGPDPFAGIRRVLSGGEPPDLQGVPLGPLTSHDPARGDATLRAYRQWAEHAGGQVPAFSGDPAWTAQRRFERLFERLALPGFTRVGRYELLVTLGRLGCYELSADSPHLAGATGTAHDDAATVAAKRVFGIGDPQHLERRARALAEAISVPIEALDLALANWGAGERATLGIPPDALGGDALERAREALDL